MNDLVTVCITTYNRDFLIYDAVERVLEQTYQYIEILIIDDFSQDNTEEVCLSILDSNLNKRNNLTYFRHNNNKGLAAARNTAIKNAKGKYFTFIDDDDRWKPTFIEEFVHLASKYDPNWSFCCGSIVNLGSNKVLELIPTFNGKLKQYFAEGYTPPVASQFYYLDTLVKIGGYREDIFTCVDHDLWLTLSIHNVGLKGLSKALAIPNDDISFERMTTNPYKRLIRLEDTLANWKQSIVMNYGEDFFEEFARSYRIRERKKFLTQTFKLGGFIKGIKFYINHKIYLSFTDIIISIAKVVKAKLYLPLRNRTKKIFIYPTLTIKQI